MRRVLAAAVLVAFMPTANAQDKGKADFSTNAEFRARWNYVQNPGLYEKGQSHDSGAGHRFKIGVGYKASEKISAAVTLLHNTNYGIDDNTTMVGDNDDGDLEVNEAYGTWMHSDDLSFKIGRMNYTIGDGAFMSANDWEGVPYSFDGLQANWEQEWGKLQFVAFKVRNLETTNATPATTSASADPEHNMYGINFDLKSKPEWLKGFSAHLFKDNSDAIEGGSGSTIRGPTTDGLDTTRYGVGANFGFGAFDLKANWEKQSGKIKHIAVGGVKTEFDYEGDMMQAEAGFSMPNMMSSRFHVKYHKDSGDDDTSATDTKYGTYDPYFSEAHGSAGLMDLFGWGNLTYIGVGWTGKPMDNTTVGVAYTKFSRTEAGTTAANYTQGENGGNLPNSLGTTPNENTKDDLGSEIDVWAEHSYGNGLSTLAILGYFTPGDYFEDNANHVGGTAAGDAQTDKQLYVLLQGKMNF